MKVLIAGGSGLIGRALTEALIERGHAVIILSRSPKNVRGLPPGTSAASWDAKTSQGWGHLVNEVDAIVNLAGASIAGESLIPQRWTEKRKRLIHTSRINAGKALVQAVSEAERKPNVLIQASGIGYYGFHQDEEINESHTSGNDFLARVSVDWEDSTKPVEDLGVRRVVIRTGLVLSGIGGVFPLFRLQFSLFAGGWMGTGKQYYSWIHIDDEVGAIIFLLENDTTAGRFNLAAPQPVTNRIFSETLGAAMRRPVWLPLPAFLLRMVLGEVADLTVKGQRVLPKRLLEAGYEFKFPALSDAFVDITG